MYIANILFGVLIIVQIYLLYNFFNKTIENEREKLFIIKSFLSFVSMHEYFKRLNEAYDSLKEAGASNDDIGKFAAYHSKDILNRFNHERGEVERFLRDEVGIELEIQVEVMKDDK